MKMLKRELKKLNTQSFRNIVFEANEDRTALQNIQEQLHLDPDNLELQQTEREKYQKLGKSSYLTEIYLQQRSKANWIRLGDENTRILEPFTIEEVKKAVFSIDINKSPGPDGYGSGFYRAAWRVIGKDITEAVLEFFQTGQLLKQINVTNIALIPKVTNPENASQFRPIACCNVIYKVISKMICLKLKQGVSQIVAENQAAFIQGRTMVHNVLICHDILRHYNRKTTHRCLMKIDLRKAYDMVS
nr:uncharacterized protein LOC108947926 [Nicotiana tomentosiformis]